MVTGATDVVDVDVVGSSVVTVVDVDVDVDVGVSGTADVVVVVETSSLLLP